jgi:hypothetical protein
MDELNSSLIILVPLDSFIQYLPPMTNTVPWLRVTQLWWDHRLRSQATTSSTYSIQAPSNFKHLQVISHWHWHILIKEQISQSLIFNYGKNGKFPWPSSRRSRLGRSCPTSVQLDYRPGHHSLGCYRNKDGHRHIYSSHCMLLGLSYLHL